MKAKNRFLEPCANFSACALLIALTAGCAGLKKRQVSTVSPAELFSLGSPISLEVFHFEPSYGDFPGTFYLAELTMGSQDDAVVTFKDVQSNEVLGTRLVFSGEGLHLEGEESANRELNDFLILSYAAWCGRWNRGRKNYWQLCGGSDCTGTGHRWCVNLVDRQTCELANTCP